MLLIVDEATGCMKAFCLHQKSNCEDQIIRYITQVKTQFGATVKFVRHDGAKEFVTTTIKKFYSNQGIVQQITVPYAHQANGTAERAIRSIVTMGRSMLHYAKLNKEFWAEAAMTAVYIKNRLPSPKVDNKTPYELVYKSKPSVQHMRVFGCLVHVLTPREKRLKWDPKSRTGFFMGYEETSKAYRVYDIETGKVVISRDVTFDEQTFGIKQEEKNDVEIEIMKGIEDIVIEDEANYKQEYKRSNKRKSFQGKTDEEEINHSNDNHENPRRSTRPRTEPIEWWKASANLVETSDSAEPTTYHEAVTGSNQVYWRKAIQAELDSMQVRQVFKLTKLPTGQHAIDTKWVFKVKRNADGSIHKYKARLVVKGFKQKYGIDYEETFSPVVKHVTLRLVIALATTFKWKIDQLDVVAAFLYGEMKEQVYVNIPEGMQNQGDANSLLLLKSIYWELNWSVTKMTTVLFYAKDDTLMISSSVSTWTIAKQFPAQLTSVPNLHQQLLVNIIRLRMCHTVKLLVHSCI